MYSRRESARNSLALAASTCLHLALLERIATLVGLYSSLETGVLPSSVLDT